MCVCVCVCARLCVCVRVCVRTQTRDNERDMMICGGNEPVGLCVDSFMFLMSLCTYVIGGHQACVSSLKHASSASNGLGMCIHRIASRL